MYHISYAWSRRSKWYKYVPKELFEEWAIKDPIANFEKYLCNERVLDEAGMNNIKEEVKHSIESELQIAFSAAPLTPDSEEELNGVIC